MTETSAPLAGEVDGLHYGRVSALLKRALQAYNLGRDFKSAAALLLNGMLLLSESAYGFIADLEYGPEGTPYLKICVFKNIARENAGQAAYAKMQMEGAEIWDMKMLFGVAVDSGKPIIANDLLRHSRCTGLLDGQPALEAFLGVPVFSAGNLLGMVGLANRAGGYGHSLLELIAPFIETCANLMEAARVDCFQQLTINSLTRRLEQSEQALSNKTALIEEMSYALRDGLNIILGYSQLLELHYGEDAGISQQVQEITKAGGKLTQLVDRLLVQDKDGASVSGRDAATVPMPVRQAPGKVVVSGASGLVLVVEDDPVNQAVLRQQLNVLGFSVHIANNGAEALFHWNAGNYGLMLTDINMPDVNGLDLTRSIRAAEQGTGERLPIIGITASNNPDDLGACFQAGMDAILPKPIELADLRQMLQQWLPGGAIIPSGAITPSDDSNPVLDTGYLIRSTNGMALGKLRGLVDLFITCARTEITLCRQYIGENNAQALALAMHKLKSSAQSVGALRFSELAKQIETVVREGGMDGVAALFQALEQAFAAVECADITQLRQAVVAGQAARPCCALVVDGDPVMRRQIQFLLSSLGVKEIVLADSGLTGFKQIIQQGGRINLLLCDLDMPEMEGLGFLRGMTEIGYAGDIIFVGGEDGGLLQSAIAFAQTQGLHLLGSVGKPLAGAALSVLLNKAVGGFGNATAETSKYGVTPEDILAGMQHNEFDVYFQPVVDACSLRPVGIEALARWRRRGVIVEADAFIQAAEHYNLISRLSEVLLVKAFFGGARLAETGIDLKVSVNLSAHMLADGNLPDFIQASLHATGLRVENVILEITEAGLMAVLAEALDVITRLRQKGFTLSIDDFGAGHASTEQLERIPFSELKLDQGLIRGAVGDAAVHNSLSAKMDMAAKFNASTVAEGVETQGDLDLARSVGCKYAQGWFIAKPMPIDELLDWLLVAQKTNA